MIDWKMQSSGCLTRGHSESGSVRQRLQVAQMIGSEQKAISRMEAGRTFVSTRILERMAEKTRTELRVEFVAKEAGRW